MRWLLLQESISLDGSLYRKLIALMYNCLARFSFLYILYLQVLWEVSHSSQTAINLALKHQKWMLWPTETAISTKKKTQLFEVKDTVACRYASRRTVYQRRVHLVYIRSRCTWHSSTPFLICFYVHGLQLHPYLSSVCVDRQCTSSMSQQCPSADAQFNVTDVRAQYWLFCAVCVCVSRNPFTVHLTHLNQNVRTGEIKWPT